MKTLIIGGTGFTGKRFLKLVAGDKSFKVLVRSKESESIVKSFNLDPCFGDITDCSSLIPHLNNVRNIIFIASMGFGHIPGLIKFFEKHNIERGIFLSTTAIYTTLPVSSRPIRLEAENCIKKSSIKWTILRPTMIYGDIDDRNIIRLIKYMKRYPVVFIPGDGMALQQPIHVDDLAKAIFDSFHSSNTIFQEYNLAGRDEITLNEIVKETRLALGKKSYSFHVPIRMLRFVVYLYEKIFFGKKIKLEQVNRINENKSFEFSRATTHFNFNPRSFKDGVSLEVENYNKLLN